MSRSPGFRGVAISIVENGGRASPTAEDGLKAQMSDRSAKVVAEVLERSFEEYRVNQQEFLATKQELIAFQAATEVNFAKVRTEIAGVRSELIKRMFIF